MATVGRNQPCPCGSGKKYKHCCAPKERAKQVREVTRHRADELLWARLVTYVEQPALLMDSRSAFSRFWNSDLDLRVARALDRQAMEAFLEWYIYDYPSSKDRQRIVERFAAEEGPRLTPEERELLAEHTASYLSLYGIEAATPDGQLQMGDLLVGGLSRAEDPGLARLAKPGDLLLGRRFGSEERGRISRGTVLLPGALGPGLVAVAKRAFAGYRDEHYQATWPQFLRESGYVMFHYLISPQAAEVYERTHGGEGYFDPRACVEAMRAHMQRLVEERRRAEEAQWAREDEEPEADPRVERTAGGILIPGRPRPPAEGQGGILLPGQLLKP